MAHDLFTSILVVITFLAVAVLASLGLKRLKFPYTIGLMIIGLGVGWLLWAFPELEGYRTLALSPELILYLILPTLIFEASLNIDARLLMKNLGPVVALSVLGLLISAAVVAWGMTALTSISLAGALLFGALISATDPVAVIALFKEVGAPKRLITLIDGESLFNDATAIVLFTVISVAVGLGGHAADPSLVGGAVSFVVVLLGGLLVGGVIGWIGSYIIQVDKGNFLFQITVSLIMAYLSFLVADHVFHFSGVMSSLAAGLALRLRAETVFKRHHIETLEHFWEYFSFVANSFVFILLGLTELNTVLHQGNIGDSLGAILWSFPIVLVARILSVYLVIPPYNLWYRWRRIAPIPLSYQAILVWGGLRGAVPVALVLAIPTSFPDRDLIVHLTMGIILFTLLIQGTTVKKVMDWLGVKPDGTPFADRPTATARFVFPAEGLTELIFAQARRGFETEGFLAAEQSEDHDDDLLFRKGPQMVTLTRAENALVAECEPKDSDYVRMVINEAVINLKKALASVHELAPQTPLVQSTVVETVGEAQAATPVMRMLRPANVVLELVPGSKASIVKALIDRLAHNGDVRDPERALVDVLEREKSMTTGLARGVATPHAKTEAVDKMTIAIGYCAEGTAFDSLDGHPSRYFALILSPKGEEGPHLQVLSMATGLLSRQALQAEIAHSATPEVAYQAIKAQAARWRTTGR